ncbi:GNAT family N-acetyltransferase [Maritalea mediterranea]|uniref:GNAT family N-acetyltransferase n=1 Tax=Maritalea mediterranea TaxID=2909667 RepID=A0ABS9E9Y5_9HYPH|nr:GNAT family N-acetyltransferase [Maritalea mediterranea]MCF4098223.1 GNAT family N-acetyltransferase [Maritalea mediterranea]
MPTLEPFTDDAEIREALFDGLRQFNARQNPDMKTDNFGYVQRDENNAIIAGIWARARMGAVEIDSLGVADAHRGKGLGQTLLLTALEEAKTRGAKMAHLDTLDFQARPFYERFGFKVFGEITFPNGTSKYWMKLDLTAD